jgi:hypothetical protein
VHCLGGKGGVVCEQKKAASNRVFFEALPKAFWKSL